MIKPQSPEDYDALDHSRTPEEHLIELKAHYGLETQFVNPPIPIRTMDWCAFRDPEDKRQGWGTTEAEAVQDWIDNYAEEEKWNLKTKCGQ